MSIVNGVESVEPMRWSCHPAVMQVIHNDLRIFTHILYLDIPTEVVAQFRLQVVCGVSGLAQCSRSVYDNRNLY